MQKIFQNLICRNKHNKTWSVSYTVQKSYPKMVTQTQIMSSLAVLVAILLVHAADAKLKEGDCEGN